MYRSVCGLMISFLKRKPENDTDIADGNPKQFVIFQITKWNAHYTR